MGFLLQLRILLWKNFLIRKRNRLTHFRTVPDEPKECKPVGDLITKLTCIMGWNVIKPFITGKILYYPDTAVTRAIMMQVNATFNEMTDLSTRTIILTTHFMDEADLLGDRIAIMSEGQLQCCGSSVFLKERLGSGYHLTVELEEAKPYDLERKKRLHHEVQSAMPTAQLQDRDDVQESELVYTLPDRHNVDAIIALLARLDKRREELSIASYAISDTSLEEIFLRVAGRTEEEVDVGSSRSDVANVLDDDSSSELLMDPLSGGRLLWHQFAALTRKRFNYARRDPKGYFTQLMLPAIIVLLGLAFRTESKSGTPQARGTRDTAIQMQPSLLSWPVVSFFELEEPAQGDAWGVKYTESMKIDGLSASLVAGGTVNKESDLLNRSKLGHECANSPSNPPGADWSVALLPSKELVYNVTGSDTETWLMSTNSACQRTRFGGVSFGVQYDNGSLAQLGEFGLADNTRIWFSTNGYASVPAYQNAINNVILRASLPPDKTPRDYGILTNSWALPADQDEDGEKGIDPGDKNLVVWSTNMLLFAMSFVPASFVMYLVEERVGQSKHLQLVSGLRPYIYWLQNYTWDLVNFAATEILVIMAFIAFRIPYFLPCENLWAVILLLFFYGMACTPLLYIFHWFFRTPSMAFLVLLTGNIFIGFVSVDTFLVMAYTSSVVLPTLEAVLLMLPQYCLGRGFLNVAINHYVGETKRYGRERIPPLDWEVTGKYLVAMAVMSVVLAVAVFLAEQSTHWWHGLARGSVNVVAQGVANKGDDVLREERRVAEGGADQDILVLKRITKRYNRKAPPAVAGVSLGVERGQCFGLLGLNGAGKTTIFKMLTGDTLISGGDALVSGRSVRADMDSVRRMTGYCPQFDALVPLLTVREHLDLYSSLRGTPDRHRPLAVRRAIQLFDLGAHKDKNAKDLSGGNKRKLSAAIALVGEPSLLYMDEPTTSMDPVARRFVWQRVRRVVASGRSVLLTSHSMEECEALCARLTIMVNGKLTCIGSPHHLKHKYGSGYLAVVRCSLPRVHEATELLLQRLQGATVVESHLHQIKLQLPPHLSLIAIFTALDEARRGGSVEDYSVTQTTLEDSTVTHFVILLCAVSQNAAQGGGQSQHDIKMMSK
ncbi:ABC-transporter, subfamily A member 04 [Frankliniella occidentalis]|nr:ABC-transporter, subfamily A member 04 [Frankliniella occidentalis]